MFPSWAPGPHLICGKCSLSTVIWLNSLPFPAVFTKKARARKAVADVSHSTQRNLTECNDVTIVPSSCPLLPPFWQYCCILIISVLVSSWQNLPINQFWGTRLFCYLRSPCAFWEVPFSGAYMMHSDSSTNSLWIIHRKTLWRPDTIQTTRKVNLYSWQLLVTT